MAGELYVRFQGTARNRRGKFPGVFGLFNGLAREGRLTAEQELFRQEHNDWFHRNLPDPSVVEPTVYDRSLNPGAGAWFKASATVHIERASRYMEIVIAHGIGCERVQSVDPGEVIYQDEHQVVVIPHWFPTQAAGTVGPSTPRAVAGPCEADQG